MTVAEALAEAAHDLEGVEARARDGGTDWSVGGNLFAAAVGATAEFSLDSVVARAAMATPDVAASRRGRDWVAFRPQQLDGYARDRAVAWFGSAYRRASARA